MGLFGKRKAAAETLGPLDVVEREVMARLHEVVPSVDSQFGLEALEQRLAVLERLRSLRLHRDEEKQKKPLFQTAAGASLITGILTITAASLGNMMQALSEFRREQIAVAVASEQGRHDLVLKPVAESVAADTTLDLDMKLALLQAIADGQVPRQTVAEFKAQFLRNRSEDVNSRATPREKSGGEVVTAIEPKGAGADGRQ